LRAGAGLVTLGVPGNALVAHAGREPDALMVRRADGGEELAGLLADKRRNAVVIGPAYGVDDATRVAVEAVLRAGRKAVLDADALASFAGRAPQLGNLVRGSGSDVVVTPHAGEFANLFKAIDESAESLNQRLRSASKIERALAAAEILGAVVVYKGADTVIAAPDGRAAVNVNAPPWLGTAGSGDVLAGMIGGLLAQGHAGFEAACAAVWLHGEAGTVAGRGLIADDLPEALHEVLRGSTEAVGPQAESRGGIR
jgi:NAD(P)H-hydrate epimerase